jgi:GcrA cell cycle regulator
MSAGPSSRDWPAARIAQLKTFQAQGLSPAEIAPLMPGVSKSAIIGKWFRLGFSLPKGVFTKMHNAALKPRQRRVRDKDKTGPTPKVRLYDGWKKPRQSPTTAPPLAGPMLATELPTEPATSLAVTIMGLTDLTCRWPLGEPSPTMLYCGAATDDEKLPYCPFHSQLAYRPRAA